MIIILTCDPVFAQFSASCQGWQDNQCAGGNVLNYDPAHPTAICFLDASGSFTCSSALEWDGQSVKITDFTNGLPSYFISNGSSGSTAGAALILNNDVGTASFGLLSSGNSAGNDTLVIAGSHHGVTIQARTFGTGYIELDTPTTVKIDPLAGTGTRCVQVDSTGVLSPTSGGCGSGSGTVTSVTGTSGQILCTPTSPNPVCSLVSTAVTPGSYTFMNGTVDALGRLTAASSGQGLYVSGGSSTTPQNLGSIATSMLACSTSAGVCTVDGVTVGGGLTFNTGTATETLASFTCGANTFVSSSSTGGLACTQPSFGNLSGSATCGQFPALTGDTHSSAGTCATVTDHLTDGGGTSRATSGSWANNQAVIVAGGAITTTNECNVFSSCVAGGDLSGTYPNPTIPTKGRVLVSATDPTIDYLDTKFESTSGTIAVTHILGPPEFVNLNVLSAPVAPDAIRYLMDVPSWPVSTGWISTSQPAKFYNGTAIEYPVGAAYKTVTLNANLIANGLTTSAVTAVVTQNGSSVIGAVFNMSTSTTTGVYSSGPVTLSSSAATDTFGVKWTNSATGSVICAFTVVLAP